jgi:CHAT domain-containing protein/tetratricopeptide (TPR) repeat protein
MRARAATAGPQPPPALIIIGLPHPQPFGHRPGLGDQHLPRKPPAGQDLWANVTCYGTSISAAAGGLVMGDWRQIAESADREWADGRIDEAVRLLRSAVPGAEQEDDPAALGSLLHNLGLALDQAGKGLEARAVLQRACELFGSSPDGDEYLGGTLSLLGMVEVELGDIEDGVSHVEQAIGHFRAYESTEGAARAQVDLGIALKDAGRLGEAEAHLGVGLAAARQAGLDKVAAHALTGLGLVAEKLERPDQARARYLEALELYRQLSDHDNEATVLYNIANLHDTLGEWDEAARWYDQALALDVKYGDLRGAADCRAALGSIEIARGHPDRAEALHGEALAFYRSGGYRRRAIDSLVDLAAIARDAERFAEAGAFLTEALRLAVELADPLELHDVQLHWGDLCFKSGDRPGARAHYIQAVDAMRQARELLIREQDALSYFGEDRVECIDRLVVLASADNPRECVEWVERAKAQELIRRLTGVPRPPPRLAPARLVLDQQQAAEQVRRLDVQLAGDEQATPDLLAAYTAAQDALRSANAALGKFDPEWAVLRLGDAPSWDDLQALLSRLAGDDPGRGVVVVHYYLRESTAAVIGLRPGRDPELVSVAIPLADLRSAAAVPGSRPWPRTVELLSALVAPIPAWAKPGDRVVLCPHDTLHRFPLHVISVGGQPMAERNVVTYVPSMAVLRYCTAKRRSAGDHALILADASPDRPLPFARDQALALGRMLSDHGISVICHAGETATVAAMADGLPAVGAAPLVHFAVHGFADPSAGLDSGLQLADGPLTARQILGLRLDSPLVCLGACDTGVSERRAGDELLGLIRSVIYAGSPSVMASQWPVDQLSSTMLILDFYRRLLDGSRKPDALRAAQLRLRRAAASDILDYLSAAGLRAAGEPRAEVAVSLARAQVQLFAYDLPAALETLQAVLARPDLTGAESREAARIGNLARLGARARPDPDYSRRPFDDPRHWAPFILIGDIT